MRPQIGLPRPVNSIRSVARANLLGQGEACRCDDEPRTARRLSMLDRGRARDSWSEDAQKGSWVTNGELSWCQAESTIAVRASIRAKKRGNARGAKGRRKTKRIGGHCGSTTANIAQKARTRGALAPLRCPTRFVGGHPGDGMLVPTQASTAAIFPRALPPREAPPPERRATRRLESRMRETRPSGSEGGAGPIPVPTSITKWFSIFQR